MKTFTTHQFLQLETQVWTALTAGNGEADAQLLADDFLGVYTSGFAEKAEHVDQLRDGPTVANFQISDAKLQVLSDEVVLLSYRAQYTRYSVGSMPELMYVTSIWRQRHGTWKNIFSQDTPGQHNNNQETAV